MKDMGVVHGRFQVLHNDHLKYILSARARCAHLVVGITNPDPTLIREDPSDPGRSAPQANPLTYFERYTMVRRVLMGEGLTQEEFSIVPFPINLPELYPCYLPMEATFYLTIYDDWGKRKLQLFQSQGLKTEVLWERPLAEKGLRAGEIRRMIALGEPWEHLVPQGTREVIAMFDIASRLRKLFGSGA
ncbi:MAG: nicotinate-nucleotide adenylyltransferase [Syntrophobacteraceae bacterium]|nr:nicotinate-nucleotide adenylyltransferase [Syntrophobacteraceae bacterium]